MNKISFISKRVESEYLSMGDEELYILLSMIGNMSEERLEIHFLITKEKLRQLKNNNQ